MKLLLDTHIWLWRELDPARVPALAATALRNPENELWLSPLSTWELIQLAQRGRISLSVAWPEWLAECLARNQYIEALVSYGVTAAITKIHLAHRDPMDWMLAATARYYRLTLVTADAQLLAGTGFAKL